MVIRIIPVISGGVYRWVMRNPNMDNLSELPSLFEVLWLDSKYGQIKEFLFGVFLELSGMYLYKGSTRK